MPGNIYSHWHFLQSLCNWLLCLNPTLHHGQKYFLLLWCTTKCLLSNHFSLKLLLHISHSYLMFWWVATCQSRSCGCLYFLLHPPKKQCYILWLTCLCWCCHNLLAYINCLLQSVHLNVFRWWQYLWNFNELGVINTFCHWGHRKVTELWKTWSWVLRSLTL